MINILYTIFCEKLPEQDFLYWFTKLTPDMQNQVSRFRHWHDAQRSLLSKALLLKALEMNGHSQLSLNDLKFNAYQKPYFENGPNFNISHSGNVVICAVSNDIIIGIDVEEVKPIPLQDFSDLFSSQELELIFNNKKDYAPFYTLWTQKEAFLKALGVGLNLPLNQVIIMNDAIHYNGITWYLQKINIDDNYLCHLASPQPNVQVNLNELHF